MSCTRSAEGRAEADFTPVADARLLLSLGDACRFIQPRICWTRHLLPRGQDVPEERLQRYGAFHVGPASIRRSHDRRSRFPCEAAAWPPLLRSTAPPLRLLAPRGLRRAWGTGQTLRDRMCAERCRMGEGLVARTPGEKAGNAAGRPSSY